MDKKQKDGIENKTQENTQESRKKEPFLSWKNAKKGLKYVGIGLAVVGGIFLLTKPAILLMALRIAIPLAVIGGVGYGVVSMVKAITGTKSSTKKNREQAPQKKQGGVSKRIIRRRKPKGSEFNKNATPTSKKEVNKMPKQSIKPPPKKP